MKQKTRENLDSFICQLCERIEAGERDYGDASFFRPEHELRREVEDECLDMAGWGFVLWCKVKRLMP